MCEEQRRSDERIGQWGRYAAARPQREVKENSVSRVATAASPVDRCQDVSQQCAQPGYVRTAICAGLMLESAELGSWIVRLRVPDQAGKVTCRPGARGGGVSPI